VKARRLARLLLAPMLGWATAGYPHAATIEALAVLTHNRCEGLAAGVREVRYDELAAIRGGTMSDSTASIGTPGHVLIAVSRGDQPTPGYGFRLLAAERSDTTAIVTLAWDTPPPDAILPQVLTHPCIVVALPRAEVEQVEVRANALGLIGTLSLTQP